MTKQSTSTYTIDSLLEERQWLAGLARSLVADPQTADDLVQDTWQRALERPPQGGAPRAWLATVLRNRARDGYRRRQRRAVREGLVARQEGTAGVDALAEQADMQRHVIAAVLALDEPYRTTVLLRYFEGLDAPSIAKRTGTTASTVRTRLSRALDRLRESLDAHADRKRWHAALLPLLGGASPSAAGTAATAGVVPVALGGLALLLVAVGIWMWQPWRGDTDATSTAAASPDRAVIHDPDTPDEDTPAPGPMLSGSGTKIVGGAEGHGPAAPDTGATEPAFEDEPPRKPIKQPVPGIDVLVVDAQDSPVAGADVILLDLSLAKYPTKAMLIAQAKTDAKGRVRFEGFPPKGNLQVRAADRGLAVISRTYDGMEPPEAVVRLVLGATQVVAGRVVDAEGAPVPDALVALDGALPGGREVIAVRRTDGDGRFHMAGIPRSLLGPREAGTSSLQIRAKGFVEGWLGLGEAGLDYERLTAVLELARVVVGRVVDVEGKPISDVSLEFPDSNGGTSTGADGRFRAPGLPGRALRILFQSPTQAPREITVPKSTSRDTDVGDITLVAGKPISGVVVDVEGKPLSGVHVAISSDLLDQFIRQGPTDEAGKFHFEHLGEGTHEISIFTRKGGETTHEGVRAGDAPVRIVVGALAPKLLLRFKRPDGKPQPIDSVAIDAVLVRDASVEKKSRHWHEGMTERVVHLSEEGAWRLSVRVPGYKPATVETRAAQGAEPKAVDVVLTAAD